MHNATAMLLYNTVNKLTQKCSSILFAFFNDNAPKLTSMLKMAKTDENLFPSWLSHGTCLNCGLTETCQRCF